MAVHIIMCAGGVANIELIVFVGDGRDDEVVDESVRQCPHHFDADS